MTFCALSLCVLLLNSSSSFGTLIPYLDVPGTTVNYTLISEDPTRSTLPGPAGALPHFGQPTGGDTLSFPSLSFYTDSSGGGGDTADSKFLTTIRTKNPLSGISNVSFTEWGDYKLIRTSLQSNPSVEVNAIGWVTVEEVNGASISPFIVIPSLSGAQFDNTYHLTGSQLQTGPPLLQSWNGSLNFDVAQALRDHGYNSGLATKVLFSLDNSLLSLSDANTLDAYIAKKGVTLTTTTVRVPEPSTLILLAMGLLGLGIWWRKN
jgi:hypothetical protein